MDMRGFRKIALPPKACPEAQALSAEASTSEAVLRISDHYTQSRERRSLWEQEWFRRGYHPLNLVRTLGVLREARRFGFFEGLAQWIEIGSGSGACSEALAIDGLKNFSSFLFHDDASEALKLHQSLNTLPNNICQWSLQPPKRLQSPKQSLVVMSYLLNELPRFPEWALDAEALLIIEPSSHVEGKSLIKTRAQLVTSGYEIWAPCCHQKSCPMDTPSKKDWCHDRIHFDQPEWFQRLESRLPIKNNTITYSYLLARRSPAPKGLGNARVIGDLRREKGKSRQLVCRSERREFLSWLKKEGSPEEISRGALVSIDEVMKVAGDEIRLPREEPTVVELDGSDF
jgi:hypothetical protein